MAVVTYFYYEKVHRTMRTANISHLVKGAVMQIEKALINDRTISIAFSVYKQNFTVQYLKN